VKIEQIIFFNITDSLLNNFLNYKRKTEYLNNKQKIKKNSYK